MLTRSSYFVSFIPSTPDVGVYDPKWLRRHMALVSQEPVLFARSIRDNIVYGLEEGDGWDSVPTQVCLVV